MKRRALTGPAAPAYVIISVIYILFAVVQGGSIGGKPTELYDSNDKLTILTNATFADTVYNKSNVLVVEFYNSWCGFCQRFAPTWKDFAKSVNAWREVAKIAVVDCANFDNNPLCRNLEIMSYPTIRIFPIQSKPGDLGVDLKSDKTVSGIRHSLIDFLEKEQQEGKGATHWPNLIPYSEHNNIWKNIESRVLFIAFIFEETTSYLGKEVILDYLQLNSAQIRRATTHNEALAKSLEVNNYPSLVILRRNMSIVHLFPTTKTREGYSSAIRTFLVENGGVDDVIALRNIPREQGLLNNQGNSNAGNSKIKVPDVVFRADLENTLRYSLKQEIAMHRVISGDYLVALQDYLRALASFFPTKPTGTMFLENLRDWVLSMDDAIKGEDFLEKIKQLEIEIGFTIPESQEWIGCKGSETKYRGYTCGLWTLFHTLTVSAASQNKRRLTPGSDNVLKTMLQYVKHFFGCEGCSKHFQEMAAERKLESVNGINEAVLWLWEAHNVVNKRLKSDLTEDPEHPKVQFPSSSSCFDCRGEGEEWNRAAVLKYLKQRYAKSNICQHEGTAISLCIPFNLREQKASSGASPTSVLHLQDVVKLGGWDFNVADISLCVFLYCCSAIILILVYIKFVVRRGYRKKYYLH
ncbi:hypothetical protein B566_EDAN004130 [Ephemera danica]|nr:hypothetical protein B566_EDAN004130 [Ephemera danica]